MLKQRVVKSHSFAHDGEEFICILKNEMKMQIREVEYHLRENHSFYFNASQKHEIMPVSEEAIYLDVFV